METSPPEGKVLLEDLTYLCILFGVSEMVASFLEERRRETVFVALSVNGASDNNKTILKHGLNPILSAPKVLAYVD